MQEYKKILLNLMFVVSAVGGGYLIFNGGVTPAMSTVEYLSDYDRFAQSGGVGPVLVIVFHALLVAWMLGDCSDERLAEHHIDSIYFLGFGYTLVALVTMFTRLAPSSATAMTAAGERALITTVFWFLAVAVTTSITGVLMRGIVRGAYVRRHPNEQPDGDLLQRNYELLREISQSFIAESRTTVSSIQDFLRERERNADLLVHHEKQYLSALNRFVEVTNGHCLAMQSAGTQVARSSEAFGQALEQQVALATRYNALSQSIQEVTTTIAGQTAALPLAKINHELARFAAGVGELHQVLDSTIDILDHKVELLR